MSRPCSVCVHESRSEIERILVNRAQSYRDIARRFAVSKDAVSRHVNLGHIAERLLKVRGEEDVRAALDVTQQLKTINADAIGILRAARDGDDPATALRAIDRIHRQLELQAKLLGDLDDRPVINIINNPEYLAVRTAVVRAVQPYPEVREAISRAMLEIESSNGL